VAEIYADRIQLRFSALIVINFAQMAKLHCYMDHSTWSDRLNELSIQGEFDANQYFRPIRTC
jgi:hypothetical protein